MLDIMFYSHTCLILCLTTPTTFDSMFNQTYMFDIISQLSRRKARASLAINSDGKADNLLRSRCHGSRRSPGKKWMKELSYKCVRMYVCLPVQDDRMPHVRTFMPFARVMTLQGQCVPAYTVGCRYGGSSLPSQRCCTNVPLYCNMANVCIVSAFTVNFSK